jgi:hypothetical protein
MTMKDLKAFAQDNLAWRNDSGGGHCRVCTPLARQSFVLRSWSLADKGFPTMPETIHMNDNTGGATEQSVVPPSSVRSDAMPLSVDGSPVYQSLNPKQARTTPRYAYFAVSTTNTTPCGCTSAVK